MGGVYSKFGNENMPSKNSSAPSGQNTRPRENTAPGVGTGSMDQFSNLSAEVLSRFQSANQIPAGLSHASRAAPSPEHLYTGRNGRSEVSNAGSVHSSPSMHIRLKRQMENQRTLTPEDMVAAAQFYSQLNQSQLNVLAAAYQQQQQQLQRCASSIAGGTSVLGHVPGIAFAQALAAVTSATKTSPPTVSMSSHPTCNSSRQTSYSTQATPHQHHQKRPPSSQSQFQSTHSTQLGSSISTGRPASASQAVIHQRSSHSTASNFGHPNSHTNLSQPISVSTHIDPNTTGLLNTHHQTRSSPSLSPSPGSNVTYQGRRSQLVPPTNHPSKRPRISMGVQQHALPPLPSGHNPVSTTATGMEALINSVVGNKAMSVSNFINPSAYSSGTDPVAAVAAATGLSQFYPPLNAGNISNSSPSVSNANQTLFQPHSQSHHQRPVGSGVTNTSVPTHAFHQQHLLPTSASNFSGPLMGTLPGSFLNSLGNNRPTFSHATSAPPQTIPNGQGMSTPTGLGSQSTPIHSTASHAPVKQPHSTSVAQNPSRLISGHLHHPHLAANQTQQNFNHPPNPLPQPNAQHHMMGHANLPQGSGVLRQQTKEPAYHPQVEAISPAPDESRLTDAQDAKLHREREEINHQLTVLDSDINKQESHLRNLCERESRLKARLAAAPTRRDMSSGEIGTSTQLNEKSQDTLAEQNGPLTDSDLINKEIDAERTYENPIQAVISDNRRRTRQRHLMFTRLCGPKVKPGPYALPLYRQPSDLSSIRTIQSNYRKHFRSKLVIYLRRRLKAEQSRIQFLAQQYSRNSKNFTKKMDKLLNSTKRRQRDLRRRDIFEKAIPEVKKNREDKENGGTDFVKSDPESGISVTNISDGNQTTPYDPVEEMNKLKEYAIDPPVMFGPWQRRYQFICESGLITDCRAQLQENLDLSKWSEEEKQIFKERFLATPKNFTSIAAHLGRKTVADCIHYYYLSKKKEGYKQLLKKHNARRRRAAQSERGGGGGGAGATGGSGTGISGSGTSNSSSTNATVNPLPPTSNAFQNGNSSVSSPHTDCNGTTDKDNSVSFKNDVVSNETQDSNLTKDSESVKSGKKEGSTGNGTSARARPGRGRPPANHGHAQSVTTVMDEQSIGSHHKGRSSTSTSRNSSDLISQSLETSLKDQTLDSSISTTDKVADNQTKSNNTKSASSDSNANMEIVVSMNSTHQKMNTDSNCDLLRTNSETGSSSSTCIKDLIHFAIEKNLIKPSSNESQCTLVPSDLPTSSRNIIDFPSKNLSGSLASFSSSEAQYVSTQTPVGSFVQFSKNNLHRDDSLSQSTNHNLGNVTHLNSDMNQNPASRSIVSTVGSMVLDPGNPLISDGQDSSSIVFPSTTAAEIYAAAARFAAASANSCGLNSDVTAIYAAAAAVAAATGVVSTGERTSDPRTRPISPQTSHSVTNLKQDHVAIAQGATDAAKRWVMSLNPSWGPSTSTNHVSNSRSSDPNVSSKAILLGDFLTAQQLDRSDPANWNSNPSLSSTRPVDRNFSSNNFSRSIDPATLPIPVGSIPRAVSNFGNQDRFLASENVRASIVPDRAINSDLFAEHAIRLAIHAKAAAAAAAANSNNDVSPASVSCKPSADENFNFSANERCVYSPLSPGPVKNDALNRLSPPDLPTVYSRSLASGGDTVHSELPGTLPRALLSSPSYKPEISHEMTVNAAQVASFVATANRRYLEEVESYTVRDRSDSMKTLTSSEASQFYGVLRHLRQQKQTSPPHSSTSISTAPCRNSLQTVSGTSPDQRLVNLTSCPVRPHSTEGAENPTIGSCSEAVLGSGSQSRFINLSYDQSRNPKFHSSGLSPRTHENSPTDTGFLSGMKRSHFFHEPLEPPSDSSLLASEARYRRRGYTESQINLRLASATATPISTSLPVSESGLQVPAVCTHSDSSHVASIDEKDSKNKSSFTTATYIDALIHSHLNKSSRNQDDHSGFATHIHDPSSHVHSSDSVSKTFHNRSNESLSSGQNSSNIQKVVSSDQAMGESRTRNCRIESLNYSTVDTHPVYSTRRTFANETTLENQINKAIADEMRAHATAKHSISPTSYCTIQSPGHSRTPSPILNRQPPSRICNSTDLQVINSSVPLKKRDRTASHSPNVMSTNQRDANNFIPIVRTGDSNSYPLRSHLEHHSVNSTTDSVLIKSDSSMDQPNVYKLQSNFSVRSFPNSATEHGDPKHLSPVKSYTVEQSNNGQSCLNTFASENTATMSVPNSLPLSTASPLNRSPSPVSDVESPGQLQIDLAAPELPSISSDPVIINENSSAASKEVHDFTHVNYPRPNNRMQPVTDHGREDSHDRWKRVCSNITVDGNSTLTHPSGYIETLNSDTFKISPSISPASNIPSTTTVTHS